MAKPQAWSSATSLGGSFGLKSYTSHVLVSGAG
jgi:hypothetical protein